MKRSRIFAIVLCSPLLLPVIALAGACSSDKEQAPQKITVLSPKEKDDPTLPAAVADAAGLPTPSALPTGMEAGAMPNMPPPPQPPPEIANVGEGVKVLLTAYDGEISECQTSQGQTLTYDVKTFADTDVHETTIATRRLNDLISKKGIEPENNNLTSRMRFDSESATGYLRNVMPNMYDSAFMDRRVESHNKMLKLIDDKLPTVVGDDEDLKKELKTSRAEVSNRLDRARHVAAKLRGNNAAPPGF